MQQMQPINIKLKNDPKYFFNNHKSSAKVIFERGKLYPFANATKRTLAAE